MQLLRKYVFLPFLQILKQGVSPHKLALAISIGVTIGFFPIIGPTTLLCFLAAWSMGLNSAAVQLANYASYPLQIIMILPIYNLALKFSGLKMALDIKSIFQSYDSIVAFIQSSGIVIVYALLVWMLIAIPTAVLIYLISFAIIKRTMRRKNENVSARGISL